MLIYISMLETEAEKQSFEKIYRENYLTMYHIALGILKSQADAENAVHEAFLKLAEKFEKYSQLACREMTGLCVTIVKNKAIDAIRRASHLSGEEVEKLFLYDENVEKSPEKMAERGEDERLVERALSELPELIKQTMVLKYYYEYSNREIAKIMSVPVKTVEMRLYRGKLKMRKIINEEK